MRPTSSLGRSLLVLRHRDQQVHSMDGHDSPDSDPIASFDRHVSSLLQSLLPSSSADVTPSYFLSIPWLTKLLHSLLVLLYSFSSLKLPNCPSLNRLLSDFSDRSIKSLDLLNSTRDGLDRVRHVRVHLDIAVSALSSNKLHRAKKALTDLSHLLFPDPVQPGSVYSHPNRSFNPPRTGRRLRTLSWTTSPRTWSPSNLAPPKPAEYAGTPVFTVTSVLLFVSWALVAVVPGQDRALHGPFPVPRNYAWAAPMVILQDMILEESRKRKNNANGLMSEIGRIEIGMRDLGELIDADADGEVVKERVRELEEVRDALGGLEGLERKVREAFHRIVRSRTEALECTQE